MMSTKKGEEPKKKEEDLKEKVTPTEEAPKEPEKEKEVKKEGEGKKERKFVTFPRIPIPSKEELILWAKRILIFLAGLVTGALGIVACASKIVKNEDDDSKDETIPVRVESVEAEDRFDTMYPEPEPETDTTEPVSEGTEG